VTLATFLAQAFMDFALMGSITVYKIIEDPELMFSNFSMAFDSVNAMIMLATVVALPGIMTCISVTYYRNK
jgi:hypothetical protein